MTNSDDRTKGMVKVLFTQNDDDDPMPESMWAEPLGDGTYRVQNSPFFFYGVSFEDVVRAAPAADGMLEFQEVVTRSGASTFRIMVREGVEQDQFDRYRQPLLALGCSLERASKRLYAVDVPPGANVDQAVTLLVDGEENGVWDWEEAYRHCDTKRSLITPRRRP